MRSCATALCERSFLSARRRFGTVEWASRAAVQHDAGRFHYIISKDQVSRDLADEVVILNTRSGIYYGLDSVGASVWNLMRQPRKFSEICQLIADEYDVDWASCATDLRELFENLRAQGLIQIAS